MRLVQLQLQFIQKRLFAVSHDVTMCGLLKHFLSVHRRNCWLFGHKVMDTTVWAPYGDKRAGIDHNIDGLTGANIHAHAWNRHHTTWRHGHHYCRPGNSQSGHSVYSEQLIQWTSPCWYCRFPGPIIHLSIHDRLAGPGKRFKGRNPLGELVGNYSWRLVGNPGHQTALAIIPTRLVGCGL